MFQCLTVHKPMINSTKSNNCTGSDISILIGKTTTRAQQISCPITMGLLSYFSTIQEQGIEHPSSLFCMNVLYAKCNMAVYAKKL